MPMTPMFLLFAAARIVDANGRWCLSAGLRAMRIVSNGNRSMPFISTAGSKWPVIPRKRTIFWSRAFCRASIAPSFPKICST